MEKIILAGGCFWCTEAIFSQLKGVTKVTPGYSGGNASNPTYAQVSTGSTGHAECVEILFDSKVISLKDLLYVFFKLHDPTTLNRQGADEGTQYRSAIFFLKESQKLEAIKTLNNLQSEFKKKIVTEIVPIKNFYTADESHKEYYFKNRFSPYCIAVIDPKIQKLKKEYADLLKQ